MHSAPGGDTSSGAKAPNPPGSGLTPSARHSMISFARRISISVLLSLFLHRQGVRFLQCTHALLLPTNPHPGKGIALGLLLAFCYEHCPFLRPILLPFDNIPVRFPEKRTVRFLSHGYMGNARRVAIERLLNSAQSMDTYAFIFSMTFLLHF